MAHVPPGWNQWAGLVGNSIYYNYTLSLNGVPEIHGDIYEDDYLTDVVWRKGLDFIDEYVNSGSENPFLMVLSVPAPHWPFTPAPQYQNEYEGEISPRTLCEVTISLSLK